jgi:transposase
MGPKKAAQQLGIHQSLIFRWRKQLEDVGSTDAFPGNGRKAGVEAELDRLRKENARLRMERDILKKAAQYFANDHQ